jgi:hypothetical protein
MVQIVIQLAALMLAGVLGDSAPTTAPATSAGIDLTSGWSLVQIGDSQGSVDADATNPATSVQHLLRIIVTKAAGPGGGRVGATNSTPISVRDDEWFDVAFLAQPEKGSVGLVVSLEGADGSVLARTTLPEIGRRGRRGASTMPAALAKYQVSLHARGTDPAAHLVITPIEASNIWLSDLKLTPRDAAN